MGTIGGSDGISPDPPRCMGAEEPPTVLQGTLVRFRRRLVRHDLDLRLVERTVELAATTKGFRPANETT
jgi:hypothetical protein